MEDATLAEILSEALADAGHTTRLVEGEHGIAAALAAARWDAAIVDLDTRARDGERLLVQVRALAPSTVVIALLPCGGLAPGHGDVPYHLAIEKPARIRAILSAVHVARAVVNN